MKALLFLGMVKKGWMPPFTVRKISNGVGVERIFPLHSQSYLRSRLKDKEKLEGQN